MNSKYIKCLTFFLLISFFLFEISGNTERGFIEWKDVAANNGYKIEIRNEKKDLIVQTLSDKNIYYPDLPKGKYEFRIAVLNIFKKPAIFSYWNPLKVIVSRKPTINEKELQVPLSNKAVLTGNNFLENTKIFALDEKGNKIELPSNLFSETKLEFETYSLKEGIYSLVLENPNNKKTTLFSFLKILPKNSKTTESKSTEKIEEPKNSYNVIDTKEISINAATNNKADIKVDTRNKNKMQVNIGPKTTEKLDISLQNKSNYKVTVDIENHSQGEVNLNVENKSTETIDLNISSTSKQPFTLTLNDNSKGQVGLIIEEKTRDKIKILNSDKKIENFDITIENKKKNKLGIEIGKPPIVFKKSKELFPPNFTTFPKQNADTFINGLSRSCASNLDVPDILIAECFDDHATLDLSELDKKILFNYLLLKEENQTATIRAAKFFIKNCNPDVRFVREFAEEKIANKKSNIDESFYLKRMIQSFKSCQTLN